MSAVLCAEDVEVSFGSLCVLRGVDIRVGAGESVAVIGANGAGKTTLMKVLAGVLEPDGGGVWIDGDSIGELTRREVARRMAVVPQTAPQVFAYTVLEFVLMGNYASTGWLVPSQPQIDEARQVLEQVKMAEFVDRPVSELSGGELQRVLIARAMMADVDIWICDEPTASLDVRHRIRVLDQVRGVVAEGGSVVAVLHDLDLVHRCFDRVVVLDGGRCRVDGAPDEVLTPQVVSSVYGVDMRRGRVGGEVVWVVEGN